MPRRQREAVPTPDPIPRPVRPVKQRFWRAFRLLAILSLLVAAIAVLIVARGEPQFRIHLLVATGLGVFFTMLVGSALMSLVFLSASSGHDDDAGGTSPNPSTKDEE